MNPDKQFKEGMVSVIMPSYNSSRFIGESIEAIQKQSYKDWELLITDDCSTDKTVEIVKAYSEKDSRIKFFALPQNGGAGMARNNSIKKAQGQYIAFCDSDDVWYPHKLEKQLSFMRDNKCHFSYSSYDCMNEEGELHGRINCKKRITYPTLIIDNKVGCLTAMYDTAKIGKRYMPTIRKRQDWGLWLNIIKESKEAYGIQEPLAKYRNVKSSISSNKIALLKHNYALYREVEGFSPLKSILFLFLIFLPYYFYKKVQQRYQNRNL